MKRVNHSVEYVAKCGANTNQVESYFSRFRSMQMGQVHYIGDSYLNRYANEAVYREDTHRKPNGAISADVMGAVVLFVNSMATGRVIKSRW